MGNTHDDVARRWFQRALHGQQYAPALKSNNLHDEGEAIYSYGHHFEVARVLKNDKREPIGVLLNGNTFSNTTSRHQSAVRAAVMGHGLTVVTIPHAALDAAGIDYATVQPIHVQSDWWTETIITKTENPGHWDYDYDEYDDYGGWINSRTGEFVGKVYQWDYNGKPRQETCAGCESVPGYTPASESWEQYQARKVELETHRRLRHGEWEEVPASRRKTGRKRIVSGLNGRTEWDMAYDEETDSIVYERVQRRHWLGGSLIRAAVNEPIRRKCPACSGSGQSAETWYSPGESGVGPMEEVTAGRNEENLEWQRERFRRNGWWSNGGTMIEIEPYPHWSIPTVVERHDCRGCSGTGRVRATRRRWAYYLSAFDENERRPSYFFCELPRGVHPTTVPEALETLKPDTVKLAESMGREVKRQGDIFAIPMPDLTLRELKQQGGVHIRRPKLVEVDGRLTWNGPRPQLLGTNHEATEVVLVGGQTYARGTITHAPEGRRPDHARTTIGRDWHLILKNTVPIGA